MKPRPIRISLAWVAALIVALSGSVPVRADLILPEGDGAGAAAASGDVGEAPQGGSYADVPDAGTDARVGYAITWDEFFGGVLLLAAAGVATYYLVINHPGDF